MPGVVTYPYFFESSNNGLVLSFRPDPISKNKAHICSYDIKTFNFECFS